MYVSPREIIFFVSLLFFIFPGACFCDQNAFVESRLVEVREEVSSLESLLNTAREREASLKGVVAQLSKELTKMQDQEHALSQELDRLSDEMMQVAARIERLHQDDKRLRELSRKRLRYFFMRGQESSFQPAAFGAEAADFGRNLYLMSRVRENDLQILNDWKNVRIEYEQREKEYKELRSDKSRVRESIAHKRKILSQRVKDKAQAVKSLEAEQKKVEEALFALQGQALRIETVVHSLTGEGLDSSSISDEEVQPTADSEEVDWPSFSGIGLSALKGKLSVPTRGKIVQGFGRQKRMEFSDFIMSKGLEYQSEPGSEVQAVAKGQVIHVGKMPGFGNIVLLHHGERYYTLYGKLEASNVNSGDVVQEGQRIATLGEFGDGGSNFYFEIRKEGSPVDPRGYLVRTG